VKVRANTVEEYAPEFFEGIRAKVLPEKMHPTSVRFLL